MELVGIDLFVGLLSRTAACRSMTIGAVPYAIMVFSNIAPSWGLFIPAFGAVGVGAALLWTAQGIYLSRSAIAQVSGKSGSCLYSSLCLIKSTTASLRLSARVFLHLHSHYSVPDAYRARLPARMSRISLRASMATSLRHFRSLPNVIPDRAGSTCLCYLHTHLPCSSMELLGSSFIALCQWLCQT
jgi:hypothetical protein